MSQREQKIQKRSERMIKLFNDYKGKEIKDFPAPPFSKWLNYKIIDVKRGEMEIEFLVRQEMANPTGLLHGGMQCGLMDDCIGITSTTLGYEGFPISIDFHVDFLGKVKVGEKVRVIGKVIREGRNIIHMTAEIMDMKGNLIAAGNSNLLKTNFIPDYVKVADEMSKDK